MMAAAAAAAAGAAPAIPFNGCVPITLSVADAHGKTIELDAEDQESIRKRVQQFAELFVWPKPSELTRVEIDASCVLPCDSTSQSEELRISDAALLKFGAKKCAVSFPKCRTLEISIGIDGKDKKDAMLDISDFSARSLTLVNIHKVDAVNLAAVKLSKRITDIACDGHIRFHADSELPASERTLALMISDDTVAFTTDVWSDCYAHARASSFVVRGNAHQIKALQDVLLKARVPGSLVAVENRVCKSEDQDASWRFLDTKELQSNNKVRAPSSIRFEQSRGASVGFMTSGTWKVLDFSSVTSLGLFVSFGDAYSIIRFVSHIDEMCDSAKRLQELHVHSERFSPRIVGVALGTMIAHARRHGCDAKEERVQLCLGVGADKNKELHQFTQILSSLFSRSDAASRMAFLKQSSASSIAYALLTLGVFPKSLDARVIALDAAMFKSDATGHHEAVDSALAAIYGTELDIGTFVSAASPKSALALASFDVVRRNGSARAHVDVILSPAC